jgi:starch synthase
MTTMPMRVAFLAAECEPWAKTGGLADVVDALARALGRIGEADIATPVDVFLPRYRTVPEPVAIDGITILEVPDPRSLSGHSPVSVIDVPAGGYRLRLVDLPAAFDRERF